MAAGDITATRAKLSDRACAVFDGVDDYVEIPHHSNFLGANLLNGFTISAWINPTSYGEGADETIKGRILDKSNSTNAGTGFTVALRGNIIPAYCAQVNINGGTKAQSAASSIVLNVWTHILVTVSSGQLANWYINGTLSGNANQNIAQTISTITNTNVMRIGTISGNTDFDFDGGIRDVRMWNRVLTTTEIGEDYAGKRITDGLILDVPLRDDYLDKSSTGLTGTNSGSYLTNTIQNRLKADANTLNLAAATDKIIAIPRPGRNGQFAIIGANRAAA